MSYRDPEKRRAYFRGYIKGNIKYRFQQLRYRDRIRLERALKALAKERGRFHQSVRRVRTARQRVERHLLWGTCRRDQLRLERALRDREIVHERFRQARRRVQEARRRIRRRPQQEDAALWRRSNPKVYALSMSSAAAKKRQWRAKQRMMEVA